jgi:hypothetical protein
VAGVGRAEALFTPSVNLDWSWAFLAQVAASDPTAEHIVIRDQAGFHHQTGATNVPPPVHILSLPPYSPELNPVERLGDLMKDRTGNTLYPTLDAIEAAISAELRPIWTEAARVRQLIGDGWLLASAHVSGKLISPV